MSLSSIVYDVTLNTLLRSIKLKRHVQIISIIYTTHVHKNLLANYQNFTILPKFHLYTKSVIFKYNWTCKECTFFIFVCCEMLRAVISLLFHCCYIFFMLTGKRGRWGRGPWATERNWRKGKENGSRKETGISLHKVVYPIVTAKHADTCPYCVVKIHFYLLQRAFQHNKFTGYAWRSKFIHEFSLRCIESIGSKKQW